MEIQVGTILELESNSYIIREQIDQGGNGIVWKTEVPGHSRVYAIKVLSDAASRNIEKLVRFGRECQFCKDTDHKHIVKVFDYVAEKGKAYCVMPYYSRNLRDVALGRIINELFTKQNPSDEAFLTVADKNPLLMKVRKNRLSVFIKKVRVWVL